MTNTEALEERIFQVNTTYFTQLCLDIFNYQAQSNPIYSEYLHFLSIKPHNIKEIFEIPFLPIETFKHNTISTQQSADKVFQSSGTSGMETSKHHVFKKSLYERSIKQTFEQFYGSPSDYIILALLPSYLENGNSSLVYMVDYLMRQSDNTLSKFYKYNFEELYDDIQSIKRNLLGGKKILLIGVAYALLDFAEQFPIPLTGHIVMETGGMKGRKKEITRPELHETLKKAFQLEHIHAEYAMTELLSQAYMTDQNHFRTPNWMKILIRESNDPFSYCTIGQAGGINIIDLANLYSCAFISTQDIGRMFSDGSIEVLGRFDNSDIRGCSLLYD